ncbi:unnamed protein product [Paramecium primaurelia]|uniref:Uncharacterized protein n=1 Tax=Paramecium primaurelia TaxID=5886 RepID=A0A8S1K4L6_PARPR|nr:unnamed protein product [Paramecium primaurelia]
METFKFPLGSPTQSQTNFPLNEPIFLLQSNRYIWIKPWKYTSFTCLI